MLFIEKNKYRAGTKEALINGELKELHLLAECKNHTHFKNNNSIPFISSGSGLQSMINGELRIKKKLLKEGKPF